MKNRTIFLSIIVLAGFLVSLTSLLMTSASPGLTCELKNVGNCPVGETCVFSLNQETNSHAGDCSYGNWKVCCQDPGTTLDSVIKTDSCDPNLNEGGVMNLNHLSNSHAENYTLLNYPYHVCLNSSLAQIKCKYDSSCNVGTCLASLNQDTNSHVANCSEYPIKICCGYGCEGTISVSNDLIDCGNSQFTVTVRNTGLDDLTVDIYDELWEDTNCDGNREGKIDEASWSVPITSGSVWSDTWTTNLAADPTICYNHTIYFCSKPFDATNTCWKGNANCIDEATAGNIARENNFGFTCSAVAGVCGDGVINTGEECDLGPPEMWGVCEPYEKCNRTTCECYDFRPECTACKYYDYCREGMNPDDLSEPCCEDPITGLLTECCVDKNNPATRYRNCSVTNAIRDLNVNVSYDFCFNEDCDMTGKCIDVSWLAHEMFQRC